MPWHRDMSYDRAVEFDSAKLRGIVSCNVSASISGVRICVENREYYFSPNPSLNKNRLFTEVASKGDYLIKDAFSDTLRLVKGDRVFTFTFRSVRVN